MGHTLTLDIAEDIYTFICKTAELAGQEPEALAAEWLTTVTQRLADDPIEKFIGQLTNDSQDWADNHDFYIGQAVQQTVSGISRESCANE